MVAHGGESPPAKPTLATTSLMQTFNKNQNPHINTQEQNAAVGFPKNLNRQKAVKNLF
jgi:hypothetical protein